MQQYIGTKIINAQSMNRDDYNTLRNWPTPANENGAYEGYLVEYTDGGKPNVEGYAGYISWSPKEQFEKAYLNVEGLTFGLAIEAMKKGFKVARGVWSSDQFIYYVPANSYPAQTEIAKAAFGGIVPYCAYIACRRVTQDVEVWTPTASDVLATDWLIDKQ